MKLGQPKGETPNSRRILAITYGGGHVTMLLPVLKLLRSWGHEIDAIGLTTAFQTLDDAGFAPRGFRHFLSNEDTRAREHGRGLAESMHVEGKVPYEESVAYLGLSYADLEDRLGVEAAEQVFALKGRHAFRPIGPIRRIIEANKPDVVLVTNCPKSETAAVMLAKEMGIPSVGVEDLFGFNWFDAELAEWVCAPFEQMTGELEARGVAPDKIVVTGNPSFDRISTLSEDRGHACRTALGVSETDPLILYAMQPQSGSHIYNPMIEEALLLAAQRSSGLRIAVRPHPSQPVELSQSLLGQLGNTGILAAVSPLDELLLACDAIVTSTSTVAVEAALLGRRVILFGENQDDPAHRLPLHQFGWADFATAAERGADLLLAKRDSSACVTQRRQSIQSSWNCDGQAATRIAETVVLATRSRRAAA